MEHCRVLRHYVQIVVKIDPMCEGKVKVHPRTGHEGPEGE